MIQSGKYKYGFRYEEYAVPHDRTALYEDDKLIVEFATIDEAEEITKMMMDFHGLNYSRELTDDELISRLKERGYKGKLTKTVEIEL